MTKPTFWWALFAFVLDLNKRDEIIGDESSVNNKTGTEENKDNGVETNKESDDEDEGLEN